MSSRLHYLIILFPLLAGANTVSFERDVRPLLKEHCFHCHGEEKKLRGGLDLRLRKLVLKGGKSGPAIELGKRPEMAGKNIVIILASFAERYLSTALFDGLGD